MTNARDSYYPFPCVSNSLGRLESHSLGREVTVTTGAAAFVCLYNAITGGFTDFDGARHAALVTSSWLPVIGLPMAPFALSTPSLGLLLGKCRYGLMSSTIGSCKGKSSHIKYSFDV
jgi:hypothetical protein